MTRVQASDSNAYDVLGVSPNASSQEIDAAFHRLIEEGGFRIGVPLRGQWLRARQIKEAYATVGDPEKRPAYDESLKGGLERPLWPATPQTNPAEAALVLPLSDWQPPPESKRHLMPDSLASGEGEQLLAPTEATEPGDDEPPADVVHPASWPEDDSSRDEINHGSAKRWGSAAAATLAIGSLVYFSWPSGQSQLSGSDMAAQPSADARQLNSGAPVMGQSGLPTPTEPKELLSEAAPNSADDTSAVADGLAVSVKTPGAAVTAVQGAAPTEAVASNQTRMGEGGSTASSGNAASTSAPAPGLSSSSSAQSSTAPEPAAAATSAPAPMPSGAQAPTSESVRGPAGVVRSPAQWVAGGPTRLDNPGGRHVGTVVVQFTVQADGRVSNCGPVRSSGKAGLDAFTCRLVEQRMRFKPAVDAQGNPVASTAHARYEWGRRRRHPGLLSWILR